MKTLKLKWQINKFYKIFGSEIGANFITKLSDMTKENVHDVLFDINEALGMYDDNKDPMVIWLKKLYRSIQNYCEPKSSILPKLIATISILFLLWGTVSTIEVNLKNHKPNPQYSSTNMWVVLFEGGTN